MSIHFGNQYDQIGQFLKVLVNKFAFKSSQKRLVTFGLLRNRPIYVKNCCVYYLGNIWKHLANFLLQHLVTLLAILFHPRLEF